MTLYLLKVHLQTFLSVPINQKFKILSCDTLVANEQYNCDQFFFFGKGIIHSKDTSSKQEMFLKSLLILVQVFLRAYVVSAEFLSRQNM